MTESPRIRVGMRVLVSSDDMRAVNGSIGIVTARSEQSTANAPRWVVDIPRRPSYAWNEADLTPLPAIGTPLTQYPPRAVYRFHARGDNYEPVARTEHSGTVTAYTRHDGGITYVIAGDIPRAERASFLLDIAGDVIPCYVAGWRYADGASAYVTTPTDTVSAVYVHPMSGINSGSPEWQAWTLGPRRAYHLILTRTDA